MMFTKLYTRSRSVNRARSKCTHHITQMSRLMGKPTICIGKNKDADQLRGNREADQRLCFRYSDSTIPLQLESEISSILLFSVTVQAGLCQTCSKTTLLVFPRGGSNSFNFFVVIAGLLEHSPISRRFRTPSSAVKDPQ